MEVGSSGILMGTSEIRFGIQKVAKGNYSPYAGITNISIKVVVVYYLVMLIARYLAKRKTKDEQKQ